MTQFGRAHTDAALRLVVGGLAAAVLFSMIAIGGYAHGQEVDHRYPHLNADPVMHAVAHAGSGSGRARRSSTYGAPAHSRGERSCLPAVVRAQAELIEARFGGAIISTHRHNANVGNRPGHPSMHRWCRAADIRLPAMHRAGAIAYARGARIGGLGIYAWGIHIDNGSVRDWGGGKRRAKHKHRMARR